MAALGHAVGALNTAEQWRALSTRARHGAAGLVQGAGRPVADGILQWRRR